jgi:integrase
MTQQPIVDLQEFYTAKFRPRMVRDKLSRSFINEHDLAVRRVEAFAGRRLQIEDLTDKLLLDFKRRHLRDGGGEVSIKRHVFALKRIRRDHNPFIFKRKYLPLIASDPKPGTLRHFYETVYRPQRLLLQSPEQDSQYRTLFNCHSLHFGRDLLLEELSDSLAAEHFAWLLKRGLKPVTVNKYRAMWFTIWRLAVELGLVAKDPRVRKLRSGHETPDAWSLEELNAILQHTGAACVNELAGIPAVRFWDALLRVGYCTGLRRGTLLKIRRNDVDLESHWLTVPSNSMKNRRGQQFRLSGDAIAAVREIWLPQRALLFPFPYHVGQLSVQFTRILDAAGVAKSHRRMGHFHKLRRTTCTFIASRANTETAAALLGHSTSSVTARYIDESKLQGRDATQHLPSLAQLQYEDANRVWGRQQD